MIGIRTAGVGVALALSAAPALAQEPAATLGKAVPAADPVVRAAAPDRQPTSLFGHRAQNTPPAGGSTQLPPPKPVDGQPNVTEQRTGPGVPGVVVPGQPLPGTQYPSYVVPGGPAFPPTGVYAPAPAMTVGGPVCDPVYGGATVSPSAPGMVAPDGGLVSQPRLERPYWGGGWDPLFPRVRSALDGTFGGNRLTLGAEYLLWYTRAQNSPPLLTTSSPAFNGIIGTGDTRVIYGGPDTPLTDTKHNGVRLSANYRLTDTWAIDGNVWWLIRNGDGVTFNSDQFPLLARPFVNANTGANFSQLVAFPGLASGAATVSTESSLWGGELNARRALFCWPCARVDALLGYRNFNLQEELNITEQFTRLPTAPPAIGVPSVTSGVVQDRFRTENHFHGVNVGLAGEMRRDWWYLAGRLGVGLGTVKQQAQINGFQQLETTTGPISAEGGLLALAGANIGTYNQSRFGVLPDAGLTVGVYLTPNLRLGVGYNVMYLNSVVRPADQIDPSLDVTRIPNFPVGAVPAAAGIRPSAFPLRTTDIFVQGITFSLMWSF